MISTAELLDQFKREYRVGINATGGAPTSWYAEAIARNARTPPDVIVIDLGSNDAYCTPRRCPNEPPYIPRPDFDEVTVDATLNGFRSAYPASACVIFVNINTHNPTWGPENARLVDAYLATFPRVVDWNDAWQPDWFSQPDDPHPNLAGQRALARLVATQVAACPARAPS